MPPFCDRYSWHVSWKRSIVLLYLLVTLVTVRRMVALMIFALSSSRSNTIPWPKIDGDMLYSTTSSWSMKVILSKPCWVSTCGGNLYHIRKRKSRPNVVNGRPHGIYARPPRDTKDYGIPYNSESLIDIDLRTDMYDTGEFFFEGTTCML